MVTEHIEVDILIVNTMVNLTKIVKVDSVPDHLILEYKFPHCLYLQHSLAKAHFHHHY